MGPRGKNSRPQRASCEPPPTQQFETVRIGSAALDWISDAFMKGKSMFKANGKTYDISCYSRMMDLLIDVWNDSFNFWDAKLCTANAADMATKAQDRAEMFWNYHHK